MAWTSHGHHIPGSMTGLPETRPKSVARCGGVRLCRTCQNDMAAFFDEQAEAIDAKTMFKHEKGDIVSEINTNAEGFWTEQLVELTVRLPCSCGDEMVLKTAIPQRDILVAGNPHPALTALMGTVGVLHEVHRLLNSRS
ncbi:hypothetical protein SEA_RUNHAAR_81 [Gordonia phage Runhaar]|nr:hypothetical protein SEA_RUNHAAR_81 [Gordonia phage Runhaar]